MREGGKRTNLGRYIDEKAAARAWDAEARRVRGARAHGGKDSTGRLLLLNFPTEEEQRALVADDNDDE